MNTETFNRTTTVGQFLPTSLRASIIAASYWVLSPMLTNLTGSVASFIGCLIGCYAIDYWINRTPLVNYRTLVLLGSCAGLVGAGLIVGNIVTSSFLLANLISPITSFNVAEFLKWMLVCFAMTSALRIVAHRFSFGAIIEILFVASAFVITLAAHRNGMIHRPYFIGDYALMRGIDPASILMVMGCGAVLCLAALLMKESNQKKLPIHFAMLGLLCFSLLAYIQIFGLPTPSYTDDLGLTGTSRGGSSATDNPFRDGENNTDNLEAPVAIVLFRDDYEPVNGSYYFRETAYSQWNGNLLVEATRSDMDQDLADSFSASTLQIEEDIPGGDSRDAVKTSVGLLVPHRVPFGLESPTSFANTPNPNNLRFKRTYDVESLAPAFDYSSLIGREVGADFWTADVWEKYLELPEDPRYGQLAREITSNLRPEYADDPFAKAFSIKTYLDENGIYSLKNVHAYEDDPAASFLFGDLTGYCMHFAYSATYMFRSLGIPTRVGIGYSVPASNRAGGSALLVQAIHGHAWPEVYFEDLGWVIIDPAPQQTLVDMTTDPQNGLQQLLGDMLRNDASFEDFIASQQSGSIPLDKILYTIYALIAAAILSGYLVKGYRIWAPSLAGGESLYRISYRAVLDRLASLGIRRSIGESREAFAKRVKRVSPAFTEITDAHLKYALGPGQETSSQVSGTDWQSLSHRINDELRQKIPTWKFFLGSINPFSWLFTR